MSEFYGETDDEQSLATLRRALDIGVTFIDTSDLYGDGHNEELVGRAIADRRDEVQLATKFGFRREGRERRVDNRPEWIREACENSLRRLGTDRIDLYYMHRRNPDIPIEESVGAMAELVEQGKVRHLGLSEVSADTLRAANEVHPIAAPGVGVVPVHAGDRAGDHSDRPRAPASASSPTARSAAASSPARSTLRARATSAPACRASSAAIASATWNGSSASRR